MAQGSTAEKKQKIFDSRYQILEIIGRGASSVVYRAKHVLSENKELALKVLLPKNGKAFNSDLLRHESLALITARHKYVIRLEDFRSVDSICYLVMEYAAGSNLSNYMNEKDGKLDPVQAERFLMQATEALSFLHNIGMQHRDIKPGNLLILNDRQIRLSDFGIATLPGQSTNFEEVKKGVGTLDYMAPEVFTGETCGPAADVYSLALTFYEALSGSHPFKNLPLAKALDAREKEAITPLHELNPDVPVYISEAIQKGLVYNREERLQNAIEFLDLLKNKESVAPAAEVPEIETEQEPEPKVETKQKHTREEIEAMLAVPDLEQDEQQAEQTEIQTHDTSDRQPTEVISAEQREEIVEQAAPAELEEEHDSEEDKIVPFDTEVEKTDEVQDYEQEYELQQETELQEIENDLDEFEYQTDAYERPPQAIWQKVLFVTIVIVIAAFLFNVIRGLIWSNGETDLKTIETTLTSTPGNNNFPGLPQGIYTGRIEGLLGKTSVPITLVALEKEQKLNVLVGLDNWQPNIINLRQLEANNAGAVIVKSNGIVLELKGFSSDGLLVEGIYINKVTNTKGQWVAKAKSAK